MTKNTFSGFFRFGRRKATNGGASHGGPVPAQVQVNSSSPDQTAPARQAATASAAPPAAASTAVAPTPSPTPTSLASPSATVAPPSPTPAPAPAPTPTPVVQAPTGTTAPAATQRPQNATLTLPTAPNPAIAAAAATGLSLSPPPQLHISAIQPNAPTVALQMQIIPPTPPASRTMPIQPGSSGTGQQDAQQPRLSTSATVPIQRTQTDRSIRQRVSRVVSLKPSPRDRATWQPEQHREVFVSCYNLAWSDLLGWLQIEWPHGVFEQDIAADGEKDQYRLKLPRDLTKEERKQIRRLRTPPQSVP